MILSKWLNILKYWFCQSGWISLSPDFVKVVKFPLILILSRWLNIQILILSRWLDIIKCWFVKVVIFLNKCFFHEANSSTVFEFKILTLIIDTLKCLLHSTPPKDCITSIQHFPLSDSKRGRNWEERQLLVCR